MPPFPPEVASRFLLVSSRQKLLLLPSITSGRRGRISSTTSTTSSASLTSSVSAPLRSLPFKSLTQLSPDQHLRAHLLHRGCAPFLRDVGKTARRPTRPRWWRMLWFAHTPFQTLLEKKKTRTLPGCHFLSREVNRVLVGIPPSPLNSPRRRE